MTVSGIDQAGIGIIQKSRRGFQFPQSKWGTGRKEEALPKMVIHKGRLEGTRVMGSLERKEEPYFSRFAPGKKKLAAIGEEIAKREIETGKAKEALLEKKYPLLYGKELLEEKIVLKPIESFKDIKKGIYRRERRGKEVTKPLRELDIEEPRIRQNILNLTSKFEQTGEIEMLDLIESKKYAMKKERKKWLAQIEKVEKDYYNDVLPIPEGLMKPLREQPPIPLKKARETLGEFEELVNERNLDEGVIKLFVKMLETSITHK